MATTRQPQSATKTVNEDVFTMIVSTNCATEEMEATIPAEIQKRFAFFTTDLATKKAHSEIIAENTLLSLLHRTNRRMLYSAEIIGNALQITSRTDMLIHVHSPAPHNPYSAISTESTNWNKGHVPPQFCIRTRQRKRRRGRVSKQQR